MAAIKLECEFCVKRTFTLDINFCIKGMRRIFHTQMNFQYIIDVIEKLVYFHMAHNSPVTSKLKTNHFVGKNMHPTVTQIRKYLFDASTKLPNPVGGGLDFRALRNHCR
jgi:hypothetical protein